MAKSITTEHRSFIAELCDELALSPAQKDTALAWCKDAYERGSEPRPNFPEAEYSQAGIEAQRQMVAEQWRSSITPLYFRAVLDMAVDADASKTNHQLARAAVKRQIRQLVRSVLRAVALAYRRAYRAGASQGECHDAALREYRRLCPDGPADNLAASSEVNRMIAAAINANSKWFWEGPDV